MARFAILLLVLAAAAPLGDAVSLSEGSAANPVRKVVTMLQAMQKKVAEEAEKADALFEKYMCYCKTSGGDLAASIEAAETKTAELTSSIESDSSKKEQLESDLKSHQNDRDAAKKSMSEATALREKEKASFDKALGESKTNLAAMRKAVEALEKGMPGEFLQSRAAGFVQKAVTSSRQLLDTDRQTVLSFLSGQQAEGYAPQSGEITGILKQMEDEMFADQKDMIATEDAAVKTYGELMAAKKKEVAALSKSIEEKLKRVGDLGVKLAEMKNDHEDTTESHAEDKKFLVDLKKNCDSKAGIHEEEKKTRAQEVVALADTIRILNDDDALELFKKTLPSASASFVQVQASTVAIRAEADAVLAQARSRSSSSEGRQRIDFISLALHGRKAGFEKVVTLIDELVATLKKEQQDDDHKKEYCAVQFDQSEDSKKSLERSLDDLATVIAETKDGIATLTEEIKALAAGIAALDKSVAEATEQRKNENAEYKDLMASNGAAKELILFAKNRLQKFYNPKLYKAAPKAELSKEDRIFVNNGGTPPPTEAPGGIAGTGISVGFVQMASSSSSSEKDAPPPPPETMQAYTKKSEDGNGVMSMMDLLVKDLDKEMTETATEEKVSQEDYEKTMADSADKRAQDSKSMNDKEAARADMQSSLEDSVDEQRSTTKEHMATLKYIQELHAECDWLLQYFDVRKQARSDEIDSLGKAKAVLSGADYSLLQRASLSRGRKFLRHA